MRLAIPLLLALACAPAPAPTPARPPGPAAAPARPLPAELVGVVEPWHAFDAAAAEAAPVWLLTRYAPGTYPCRPGPDGSLDMLLQDRFSALRVIRGAARAPGVDLDLHALRGPSYPRAYAEGRRYLLLLRPGPKGQVLLADPEALGGPGDRLGPDEVLGVVDLDQTEAEAAAEQVAAARTGAAGGVRWDPAQWQALRSATAPDPARQRELAAFLQDAIVRPRAPLAEVRAWLGPPDAQQLARDGSRRDEYVLARPARTQPVQGAVYGHLRLRYDARLELRAVELGYLRWRVSPREQASVMLTADEHTALGLPRLELEFR